jgi:hypothetical protein
LDRGRIVGGPVAPMGGEIDEVIALLADRKP